MGRQRYRNRFHTAMLFILLLVFLFPGQAQADRAGEIRYNYTTQRLEFHDGAQWYNFGLGVGLGACTKEGDLEFDNLLASYQVCNGTTWIKIIGIPTLAACTKKGEMDFNGSTFLVCNGLLWTDVKGAPSV